MRTLVLLFITVAFVAPCAHGRALEPAGGKTGAKSLKTTPRKRLPAFRSERELKRFLRKLARAGRGREVPLLAPSVSADANASAAPATPAGAARSRASEAPSDAESGAEESVTNVQHAGVDEGGIVKLHGDYLVVLRRGRLFTIDISGGSLRPVSAVDAFGPDIEDAEEAWYDELLVSGETVAVVGYSYERGGTEVGLFRIDRAGRLSYRATYQLRSDDYYSSRNYASRLIGDKLIFYAPLFLSPTADNPFATFPAQRRWRKGGEDEEFRRIVSATRVYRAGQELSEADELALHTVTVCDLGRGDMNCAATVLVGPPGHTFYVSPAAVYVWTSEWSGEEEEAVGARSTLYRMPLDGTGPSALRVSGGPVDQFSFLESEDGHLNVLVRPDAAGDWMWSAETTGGEVALMRVPVWSFSDGTDAVPTSSYRQLPEPQGGGDTFHNRFVGDYLLYGNGCGWDAPSDNNRSSLYAVRWAGGAAATVPLEHGVDRIEALGSDAVVVGADKKDLHFTSVRLSGGAPQAAGRYTRKGAAQGELRSHGFFYKPEGPDSGLLGLPISTPGRPGYEHLFENSAAVLFLRNESLSLSELGELSARPETAADDDCRASCVDWYGNARPLFLRGRVFALLGYELVEGSLQGGRFVETRRVSYAPRQEQKAAR